MGYVWLRGERDPQSGIYQSFGEINMMLSALFGVKPAWFSDPTTARTMLIIVNTWLGNGHYGS